MIDTKFDSEKNIAVVTPGKTVSAADLTALSEAFNAYINTHDSVPNVVIRADGLPHWQDMAALKRHIKFIRDHQRVVAKLALVTDSPGLALLPMLARLFVKTTLRRFSTAREAEALAWVGTAGDGSGHFEMIKGLPHDVLALRACGIITAQDYTDTLEPLVEGMLREHDRIKVLLVLDEAFQSYTGGALWDDAKLGLRHFRSFSRVALVTDHDWVRRAILALSPLSLARVRVFPMVELEAAREWIKW